MMLVLSYEKECFIIVIALEIYLLKMCFIIEIITRFHEKLNKSLEMTHL